MRAFYPSRPWPGTHEPPSLSGRAGQRFERSENALDVAAGCANYSKFAFGMVSFFICELFIYLLAVSCSSGPFHTRQFASKLSVADVYESRHNKAACWKEYLLRLALIPYGMVYFFMLELSIRAAPIFISFFKQIFFLYKIQV